LTTKIFFDCSTGIALMWIIIEINQSYNFNSKPPGKTILSTTTMIIDNL